MRIARKHISWYTKGCRIGGVSPRTADEHPVRQRVSSLLAGRAFLRRLDWRRSEPAGMITKTNSPTPCKRTLDRYFRDLDGEKPTAIYDMVLNSVEKPLIEAVLARPAATRRCGGDARHQSQHPAQENPAAADQGVKVARALISVSDKTGVVEFARALAAPRRSRSSPPAAPPSCCAKDGIAVTEVSELHRLPRDARRPGQDPAPEGPRRHPRPARRPRAHGGDRRARHPAHRPGGGQPLPLRGRPWPSPDCTLEDAIENIDIGGPTMLRAAAKNHGGVAVVIDPADYAQRAGEMSRAGGARRRRDRASTLATKAFAHTAAYDGAIANYLTALDAADERRAFPRRSQPPVPARCRTCATARIRTSRRRSTATCGRCPAAHRHRVASCRARNSPTTTSPTPTPPGNASRVSQQPACVIVKHANPCGVARGRRTCSRPTARPSRPTRPRPSAASSPSTARWTRATAEAIGKQFVEVIIAPRVEPSGARAVSPTKQNLRVLDGAPLRHGTQALDYQARRRRPAGAEPRPGERCRAN